LQNYVPLVLALEPDLRQATILKRMIRDRVHAELVVVDSRDEAISAVDARLPDVILFTALLSPRDEAEIISHLRTLAGAEHVQTHTIPQLASATPDGEEEAPQGGQEADGGRLARFSECQGGGEGIGTAAAAKAAVAGGWRVRRR
jgi:CheY-like chemotaxis protein